MWWRFRDGSNGCSDSSVLALHHDVLRWWYDNDMSFAMRIGWWLIHRVGFSVVQVRHYIKLPQKTLSNSAISWHMHAHLVAISLLVPRVICKERDQEAICLYCLSWELALMVRLVDLGQYLEYPAYVNVLWLIDILLLSRLSLYILTWLATNN